MLVPGSDADLSLRAAVIRCVSAGVRPVTLEVLYMKLLRGPVAFMN